AQKAGGLHFFDASAAEANCRVTHRQNSHRGNVASHAGAPVARIKNSGRSLRDGVRNGEPHGRRAAPDERMLIEAARFVAMGEVELSFHPDEPSFNRANALYLAHRSGERR